MKNFTAGALLGATLMYAAVYAHDPAATQRFPQFQNSAVRVWRTIIPPHTRSEMHRHDHARVAIALTSGTLTFVDDHGAREDHPWQAGSAYWLTAMPPGAMHADVNDTDQPIEVMMVELQNDAQP